ncbi:hypothetical protein L3V83_05050 [Thiotrichales bacterium 19X7-9]|nr:hypothetical protein [Thiotrichales bacterium 19X7-9]
MLKDINESSSNKQVEDTGFEPTIITGHSETNKEVQFLDPFFECLSESSDSESDSDSDDKFYDCEDEDKNPQTFFFNYNKEESNSNKLEI